MVIEINKDIDRYQESVALGLSAKQLVFSIASVAIGGGLVFLLYRYIGLTASAYVAIPVVAPIALGGFYTYNGMSFYDVMARKFHFMFGNKALTYLSTEGELTIKAYELELAAAQKTVGKGKKGKAVKKTDTQTTDKKNREEFEAMKQKTKNMLLGCLAVLAAAVAGIVAYKYMK